MTSEFGRSNITLERATSETAKRHAEHFEKAFDWFSTSFSYDLAIDAAQDLQNIVDRYPKPVARGLVDEIQELKDFMASLETRAQSSERRNGLNSTMAVFKRRQIADIGHQVKLLDQTKSATA